MDINVEDFILMSWASIRTRRDQLIKETDFTQLPDSPLTSDKKLAFAEYRQALRDIPQTNTSPDNIVWPVKPEVE
ncbi:tail fiber assembly protein [uncultured Shewanella sp.]|uniref:tail fiber assembly protein n=1 Tax=uncultured Shewanella sp. TaxID=173975 RepID=UPI00261C2CBA|nr:tail fiber assembly protein [uncultured Shewanella sp.]